MGPVWGDVRGFGLASTDSPDRIDSCRGESFWGRGSKALPSLAASKSINHFFIRAYKTFSGACGGEVPC